MMKNYCMNYLGNSIFGIFSYLNINNLLSKLLSYIRTATPNHLNNHINDEKNITLFPIEPVPLEETPLFQQQDLEHLMKELKATYGWVMENPRGMLRKQEVVKDLARHTITYCQYGDTRMKPTDVWFTIKNWTPRKMCSPRASCHESSPAGTNTNGTGKLRNAKLRSIIPYELGLELLKTIEGK